MTAGGGISFIPLPAFLYGETYDFMTEYNDEKISGMPPMPSLFTDTEEDAETGSSGSDAKNAIRGRGLYRYIKISERTLDKVIVGLSTALIICMAVGLSNRGYLIEFDSMGGTSVESVKLMYGDMVEPPKQPCREGYVFTGWYRNADCLVLWHLDTDEVTEPMTLYAGWESLE